MPAIELAALLVGDEPSTWETLGFAVEGKMANVSGVAHVLDAGAGAGVRDWGLRGLAGGVTSIDGLALGCEALPASAPPDHPNGVVALDHVVMTTPDLGRTIAALEAAGLELRRVRDAGRGNQQAFFRVGEPILELVGPTAPKGDGPPRFYGLAWTVRDLDETAAYLGERLRPAKDAVQKGRRIATLDRSVNSTVPHAFMTA